MNFQRFFADVELVKQTVITDKRIYILKMLFESVKSANILLKKLKNKETR